MPDLPHWQPLEEAPLAAPAAGRVVAVVATEAAASDGWGATAAIGLARSWSEQGSRVVLADAAMARPSLHAAAGVPNREGLADATLFGASFERVAQTPEGERFLLVTAGTPLADSAAVARDPRWHRIVGSAAEAGATLVLYLVEGESSTAAFLGSASDIVVLAGPDAPTPSVLGDLEPLVRAVTGPVSAAQRTDRTAEPDTSAAVPAGVGTEAKGGMGKMLLFVLLAIVVAAALGFFLSSGLG